ncbi:NHLP bacteriocin export ABC transporter permease/ATPase subunit [Ramlibacter terrae]|uniref:NHLP bacteriocin export ABC transporter permease/ATPase subunit n=1 Tax=Ramlibacter terrae TaxID=2732511 RepID=A0ABX6P384_9BURK|nr:NHLP bacteriocin export ABC transporter permease/ATPase subunit [Ramlibacter terrae]
MRLAGDERLWRVEAGTVDVFAAPARDGQPVGAREHLYRAAAGDVFSGLAQDELGTDWQLLAVPGTGTRLRALDAGALHRPPPGDEGVQAIARWVRMLGAALRGALPPRDALPLAAGMAATLAAGRGAVAAQGLVFVRVASGAAQFMGQPQATLTAADPPLPLADPGWLAGGEGAELQVLPVEDALAADGLGAGLRRYHALVLRHALHRFEGTAQAEAERMQRKARNAGEHRSAASPRSRAPCAATRRRDFGALAQDPLLASCQLVGARIGVDFAAAPPSGVRHADPVEEIATASRVRSRQVALRGAWWRSDAGPLLGRLQDGKQPVALLWDGARYQLHDPVARTVRAIDEAVAAALQPFAHTFFVALPERPLGWRDLGGFALRRGTRDVRRVLGLSALVALLGLLLPVATAHVFDALIPAADRGGVAQVTAVLVAVALAAAMFSLARGLTLLLRLENRADAGLQAALWDRVLKLPATFFRRYGSGDLAERLGAIAAMRQVLSGTTLAALLGAAFSLGGVVLLLYYDVRLGATALALIACVGLLSFLLGLRKLRYDRQVTAASGRLSGLVLEYLRGVTKLRVTGAEARAFANWAGEFARMRRMAFASGRIGNLNEVLLALCEVLVQVALFALAAWLLKEAVTAQAVATATGAAARGTAGAPPLTTGQFIAFPAAFAQVMGGVLGLSAIALSVLGLVPLYERLQPLLQAEPESGAGKSHPGELQGRIDVVNLGFGYDADGPPVLEGVSFSARPGDFIAVVGPSGSGKSTLLRCLLGFEQPQAGGVLYDDQNLADLDAGAVRRQFGVVLQHSQLMPGDLFTNIVGTTQLGLDAAWEAARACGLEEDIQAMPMGMHTVLSEGGTTLSGGQRQRLLVARAVVQRPRILLFDEATSALDNRTQDVVTRSLSELRATRIVIAHRLSTVMNADRILVMDRGRIVQGGTYQSWWRSPACSGNSRGASWREPRGPAAAPGPAAAQRARAHAAAVPGNRMRHRRAGHGAGAPRAARPAARAAHRHGRVARLRQRGRPREGGAPLRHELPLLQPRARAAGRPAAALAGAPALHPLRRGRGFHARRGAAERSAVRPHPHAARGVRRGVHRRGAGGAAAGGRRSGPRARRGARRPAARRGPPAGGVHHRMRRRGGRAARRRRRIVARSFGVGMAAAGARGHRPAGRAAHGRRCAGRRHRTHAPPAAGRAPRVRAGGLPRAAPAGAARRRLAGV